ncbi:radial spoke head protein 6 homolog A [Anoplophora glabripennis]|uniref:radial spoke head protein 6 homolog A n=1 Tax=Anoplophora glabripennis TaxID=217634 RepID=UPI000A136156|nr:radial spoke head protein 6 homolog A [Anoplophora glabripennis]
MISDYDVQGQEDVEPSTLQIPQFESEFNNAKTFLQKASTATGENLYDHLTEVLNKILAERPENVIDFFEEYSRKVKEQRFKPLTDHLEDIYVQPGRFALSNKVLPLLKALPPGEPSTVDPEDLELADMSQNNLLELLYYLEQCGIGLPRPEMIFVMISMRNLAHTKPISSIRFWGKIFGTLSNYLIVEAELKEDEHMKRNEHYQEEQDKPKVQDELGLKIEGDNTTAALLEIEKRNELEGEGEERKTKYPRTLPPEPVIQYQEPPEAPPEPSGVGVNKKVYYVCNDIGEPWVELPDANPKQIRVAREIYKSFTGTLDAPVLTYPEFPGLEKEYLRAQIARITAGTKIAPLGYYTFGGAEAGEDEEEEEAEEAAGGEAKTSYKVNPKYDPPPLRDLLDTSMSFWVHSEAYILPQGRTTWWNPNPMPELGEEPGEGFGEEEEEAKPKGERMEPETGPPLLTPLSEDAVLETVPPWSLRVTSEILENYALAVVRSNIWPGAYCFSNQGKIFRNVYLGYGHKYMEHNFSPVPLPPVQQEYPIGPEIMEMLDPTGADEEQWRIDHLPKPKPPPMGEEAEGEEAEEEEEEEEEDD